MLTIIAPTTWSGAEDICDNFLVPGFYRRGTPCYPLLMEITYGTTYYIKVRLPWGELRTLTSNRVTRDDDGTVRWHGDGGVGLEPVIDNILQETDTHLSGWLGGTCDTVAVIALGADGPLP